jgi:hypothetical protein
LNFTSPHSKSECIRLFRAAVDPAWSLSGQAAVIGWTGLGALHARKRIGYRNSFQTVLVARLRPSGGGTHVSVSTGMSGLIVAFLIVWFGFSALLGLALAFSDAPSMAMYALGFIAFGIALVSVGRYLARDEAEFLTEFLIDSLELERVG